MKKKKGKKVEKKKLKPNPDLYVVKGSKIIPNFSLLLEPGKAEEEE